MSAAIDAVVSVPTQAGTDVECTTGGEVVGVVDVVVVETVGAVAALTLTAEKKATGAAGVGDGNPATVAAASKLKNVSTVPPSGWSEPLSDASLPLVARFEELT